MHTRELPLQDGVYRARVYYKDKRCEMITISKRGRVIHITGPRWHGHGMLYWDGPNCEAWRYAGIAYLLYAEQQNKCTAFHSMRLWSKRPCDNFARFTGSAAFPGSQTDHLTWAICERLGPLDA